jgi:hypothetical protein
VLPETVIPVTLSTVGAIASTTIPPGLDASSVPPEVGRTRLAAFRARSVMPVPTPMGVLLLRFDVPCAARKV